MLSKNMGPIIRFRDMARHTQAVYAWFHAE
jgi:hypothetical protein